MLLKFPVGTILVHRLPLISFMTRGGGVQGADSKTLKAV